MKNNKSQFFSTRKKVKNWLDNYHIKNYTINDDLSVDVNGDVNISSKNLKAIPVNFRKVTGSFYCYDNELTSLIGSPETVDKSFCCNNNKLINLVDSPKSVSGAFWCHKNKLISLEGSPKFIGGDFCCEHNLLTSLIEIINCNFNTEMYFNIDTENFTPKELIQTLKKYYHNEYEKNIIIMNMTVMC